MLTHIQIRDFAIIDSLELDLQGGLTVITGETGAGKSIMIDAIGLVLGDRATANVVREGAAKAEISLHIDALPKDIISWLRDQDLDADEECILRRVITAEGRSRCYINGSSTTLGLLKNLGTQLVNIHGQHAHQHLLQPTHQRALLDAHGHYAALLDSVREAHNAWRQAEQALQTAQHSEGDRLARIDLLRFQLTELETLNPGTGEFIQLETELRRLSHADRLKQTAASAVERLYEQDETNLYREIADLQRQMQEAGALDAQFLDIATLLESAQIQIEEAAISLRELFSSLEVDPDRLADTEQRYNKTLELARKHQVLPEALPELMHTMRAELSQLEAPETSLDNLESARDTAASAYDALAVNLSKQRRTAAQSLDQLITEAMQTLGLEGGQFVTQLMPLGKGERSPSGNEKVRFLVSANPGQSPKPLNQVASGGELSRISLAISLTAAQRMQLPTLIFDEVDSGIGGAVAETVGQQLRSLGRHCQVFCVTHLPQVAACGHQHLRVEKKKARAMTHTGLLQLDASERIDEIARMLGGKRKTQRTLEHATELLAFLQQSA